MFFLILLIVLFYQGSIVPDNFSQQYLFLAVLILLSKHNTTHIKYCDQTNYKPIIPETNCFVNSNTDCNEDIFINEKITTDNNYTDKMQKTNNFRNVSVIKSNYDDEEYYNTINLQISPYGNRHHYYDTKIYHNKKAASGNYDEKTRNTNEDITNYQEGLEIEAHTNTQIPEKNMYKHSDIQHNEKVSPENCNIIDTVNKKQCIPADKKETLCSKKDGGTKKTVSNVINKKCLGQTISIIFGDFGLVTGKVIFMDDNITGLKLENGIVIYLNDNDIKAYY